MTYWRSCDNCFEPEDCWNDWERCSCLRWKPIPCKRCGGPLSEVREHKGRKYRHCYSCHFEFFEEE